MEDCGLRLPSGWPRLRVLSVSCVVRQRCALDLIGRAADDAERIRRRREEAEGEEATRAGKGSASQGTSRGIGERGGNREGERSHKCPRTKDHPNQTVAAGYRSEREGRGRQRARKHSRWGGGERRCAQVRPDPGVFTSPGGLRRLGSRESGHTSGRQDHRLWDVPGFLV